MSKKEIGAVKLSHDELNTVIIKIKEGPNFRPLMYMYPVVLQSVDECK